MLSTEQRSKIQNAYSQRKLKIRSISPQGNLEWKRVLQVHRAETTGEALWEASTEKGPMVLTGGHRIFLTPTTKLEMDQIQPGAAVLGVEEDQVGRPTVLSNKRVGSRAYMYDLTAESWHNFVLHRSGVVISNSPDKFYHFRPPEHEGNIGQFNRVFGQVWEDIELREYLERALDWWNMFPPETEMYCSLDTLWNNKSVWRTTIYWGAMIHALFALALNWVHEEFDYSIGGISLSIEKSSKYESLKQNAESQMDKAVEAKARTVKYMRGLKQPRFGVGVRSAFGPHVGQGVLSPRNFLFLPLLFTTYEILQVILGGCC